MIAVISSSCLYVLLSPTIPVVLFLYLVLRCPRLTYSPCAAIHENVLRELRKTGDTLYNDR